MSTADDGRARPVHELRASTGPLAGAHDTLILDLDGVVYVGPKAVRHAPEVLDQVRGDGAHLAYVTNNASRTPAAVAAHLGELGVKAEPDDVVTSAQAVARLIARQVTPGAAVLVVGGSSLADALAEHGLRAVSGVADRPAAVVQGFDPSMSWARLAECAYAVQVGTPWFASNVDATVPTDRGIAPGNGAFVAAVMSTTRARPTVAGKPEPGLFDETILRVGGTSPIVIGDRLDTDIEGANRIGAPSLAVLTGVSDLSDIVAAEPMLRPTYIGPDLRALTRSQPAVVRDGEWCVCDGVGVRLSAGVLELGTDTGSASDGYGAAVGVLRAALSAAWNAPVGSADPVDVRDVAAYVDERVR
ncbi:MAG: HAD-IIA family hydrolase [Nocardioidaceae bacterium]